ncbi:histidine kinase [Paenibacillus sp. BK720]|uniref:cache domain-containing sensor histidine kinase n=1 Tax=Paenibacillus sp. BK720 TaxID=2587092 RepID=UPI001420CFF8|nr:histidine kinase [Paenibacillus sp. BK720]NIK70394.1 two-component system sensor histidine kinase YesM [Paenibacillus sp. BK720]
MFKRIKAIPWNSIPVKLVLGLLGITLPLIALLLYNNSYSMNVIHSQVAASNKNLIDIYMNQTDGQLTEVERHMAGLTSTDLNVQEMGDARTEDEFVLAKTAVYRKLTSDLSIYPAIDGFYVYSLNHHDGVEAYRGSLSYPQLMAIRQTLADKVSELTQKSQYRNVEWKMVQISGEAYLVRLMRDGDLFVGAWVKASTVVKPLLGMRTGKTGAVLLVDDKGYVLYTTRSLTSEKLDLTRGFRSYYLSGGEDKFLVVGESSAKGSFSLAAAIPDESILENLPYLTKASAFVILLALLMLPLSFLILRKVILQPLSKMVSAMRLIGKGNFNIRINPGKEPDEIRLVNRTFNAMISKIEELKINVYEEQLSKQRAELKHLQLQINPHFFMNSLNILYNLAQVKQFEPIQEMTMHLVQYFRYMFQSHQSLVPLKNELRHIRHYLRIQQMRFPDTFTCEVAMPAYLETTAIPPLILQTVVENSIKHAVKPGEPTKLIIEAELDDLAEEPMVAITIRDTGEGYSDAALFRLREGQINTDEAGEHIGLWNIRERLKLQYGDKAWMECYNDDPHGAVTEIVIPLNASHELKE